ncbi:MAG: FG-GAP repeat protein [Ignavibacteria bacterium]|nr:FG-GAP repeat protein [Ignavibacteria bacterium]
MKKQILHLMAIAIVLTFVSVKIYSQTNELQKKSKSLPEGDKFGISVSSAGDINGDGFFDVIAGANFNDAGGSNAGRAYIYFGGNTMNNVADVILTGASVNDFFGSSLSSAGDVNSDGYSDVIVGAIRNDAGGTDAGRAYIYFGGSVMNNIADVTLTGVAANDFFGYSVSESGDVNADGYSDVLVGAPNNDNAGTDAGRAYMYFGGAVMNNVADITLNGAAAGDNFGWSVSSASDVNGDGFFDIIIGAPGNDAGGSNAGRANVYFGGVLMDNISDIAFTGSASNDNFGWSVSSAGDVNGDSYSDVIIGAPNNSSAGANYGRAYVYFGGISMDNIADEFMSGSAVNDNFGYSVSSAGDINGDGYSDLIAGEIYNDAGGLDAGRVYVYINSMIGTDIPNITLTGEAAQTNLGFSVSSAGDVNGDGYNDMIAGAPGYSTGGTIRESIYILWWN